MSNRNIKISEGEYYHIYSRGVDKRDIFLDRDDYERFMKLLFVANGSNSFVFRELPTSSVYKKFDRGEPLSSIGAYCLMPNHFHILIKETKENGISMFLRKLLTSYSSYFNKKYNRTGGLFGGNYKARHADNDEYLKYLFSYISLNPVKIIDADWKENGIKDRESSKKYLKNYRYSSYQDYIGVKRDEGKSLNVIDFPEYFSNPKEFDDFINEWLVFNDVKNDT